MTAARLGGYVLLAAVGVLVGIAGALVQAAWFPGGLLLALLGLVALCYGGLRATRTRLGGVAPAVGWAVVVVLLTSTRPEGDFMFGPAIASYVFLLGGMLAAVMSATLPKLPRTGPPPPRLGR